MVPRWQQESGNGGTSGQIINIWIRKGGERNGMRLEIFVQEWSWKGTNLLVRLLWGLSVKAEQRDWGNLNAIRWEMNFHLKEFTSNWQNYVMLLYCCRWSLLFQSDPNIFVLYNILAVFRKKSSSRSNWVKSIHPSLRSAKIWPTWLFSMMHQSSTT